MNTQLKYFIDQVRNDLAVLKETSDLNKRIHLKDTIQRGREALLAKLMLEDVYDPNRFELSEVVVCWHPSFYLAWGDVLGEVVGFEIEPETNQEFVKVMSPNGIINRFAPQFLKHNIEKSILNFSFWP